MGLPRPPGSPIAHCRPRMGPVSLGDEQAVRNSTRLGVGAKQVALFCRRPTTSELYRQSP
jgi:hypothetical protein